MGRPQEDYAVPPGFDATGHPRPNTSFQRARVRGGRGPGPLNSKR